MATTNVDKKKESSYAPSQPIQEGAKSSLDQVELPTGYLDEDGNLHTTVELKELTGEEEDILTSRKMSVHVKLGKILENCVVSIGSIKNTNSRWSSILKDLVATDRLFLILQLRILSLGPLFSAKMQCSSCEEFSNQTVDLNDFKIKGLSDPLKRTWTGVLPKSKLEYTAKCQTGWEDAKLANISNNKDSMSLAMMGRLVDLGGKPVNLQSLKKLGWADRQQLRKEFTEREGDIDNFIEYECSSCGHENKERVDIGHPNFFFPSETSES